MENAGAWANLAEDNEDEEGAKPKQNGGRRADEDDEDEAADEEGGGDDLWEQFQSREEQQLQQVPFLAPRLILAIVSP